MNRCLPVGYELHLNDHAGKYIITDIIGKGASTVAYCVDYYCDDGNCSKHIIKEFNPSYIPFQRTENGEMQFNVSDKSRVATARERFLSGCHNQLKIRNQIATMNQTPPVEGPFYANNTIYMDVIAYNGTTYDVAYENLSLCDRMKVCLSVAELVKCYHDAGYLCLDIKPENIFVIPETKELLYFIDFDSICTKEEIVFGNLISYTKQWAAPEQLNPYAMDEISEATDIYAIGELVFWSVFERHSTIEERRWFSVYPFENIRPQVSNILVKLFHNTLRPSVSSRFKSINDVIALLNEIIEEQSKKEYIVASAIRPKDFFVGRENELAELDNRLKKEKIIFLYGIGGIGKSEIAKQYAILNAHKYQNILYWTFNEDFESTICQDDSVSISNVSRVEDESDHSYCWRKLRAIKNCLKNNNLIIIDNLNHRLEDILNQEVWEYLLSFPCEIIVTTRSSQMEHELLIREIADFSMIKKIFSYNCPYENNQDEYVDEIIHCVDGHTLLLELISKQTFAAERSPKETLALLKKHGVYGTGKETVGMIKDGHRTRETVFNHMRNIFSMSDMSLEQKLMMTKAAFLPELGVASKDFCAYYKLEDKNNINWLIENGWIYRSSDSEHILSVHPVVAEVIIAELKENLELQNSFYSHAFIAMRKGYDDISVNAKCCDYFCETIDECANDSKFINGISGTASDGDIKNTLKEKKDKFISEYAKSDVSQAAYHIFCNAIVNRTTNHNIKSQLVAKYITQYVEWFKKYGRYTLQLNNIQYAIDIYNEQDQIAYTPDREYAYSIFTDLLLTQCDNYSQIMEICSSHLKIAKKAKDWNMACYWCANLAISYFSLRDYSAIKYQIRQIYYGVKAIRQNKTAQKRLSNSFSVNITKANIRSAELYESMFELYPPADFKFTNLYLKLAIAEREKAEKTLASNFLSDNSIRIVIDEAKMHILKNQYSEAQNILCILTEIYRAEDYKLTLALLAAYELLGDIYVIKKQYDDAINIYQYLLVNSELMNDIDKQMIKTKLGRVINLAEYIEWSKEYNISLLSELKQVENKNRSHIIANSIYNVGEYYLLIKNYEKALEYFAHAREIYETATHMRLLNNIGKARSCERIAYIEHKQGNYNVGDKYMAEAISILEDMLGSEHPEVTEFKERQKTFTKI